MWTRLDPDGDRVTMSATHIGGLIFKDHRSHIIITRTDCTTPRTDVTVVTDRASPLTAPPPTATHCTLYTQPRAHWHITVPHISHSHRGCRAPYDARRASPRVRAPAPSHWRRAVRAHNQYRTRSSGCAQMARARRCPVTSSHAAHSTSPTPRYISHTIQTPAALVRLHP